jgi:hypothetical protein
MAERLLRSTVRFGSNRAEVQLSPEECWQLYVSLGEEAPFVRNQLSVTRNGGSNPIAVTTARERRHILDVLGRGPLSDGLHSLRSGLEGVPN